MKKKRLTAREASLISCHICGKLFRDIPVAKGKRKKCARCGATLHTRKPESLARTWALVISGLILYIPANVYPIMTVTQFGRGTPDTIISGIIALFNNGLWSIGVIIFVASVLIPVLKLVVLVLLLLSVHFRWKWNPRQRTLVYKIVEKIGKWSMLDIFMISILAALVKLGFLLNVTPNRGASAFGAVVVVTMFASMSFDPRLIWDREHDHE
ncbi:MAG: paraquat-inducible protein A [Proteobacteria bacterium]|nr:paraquat-inducible protein A [Pseudomonadota bacterium]